MKKRNKHVCDPNTYPECCWDHKRASILNISKSNRTYCKNCDKYHDVDISNLLEYASSNSESGFSTSSIHSYSENNESGQSSIDYTRGYTSENSSVGDRPMNLMNNISLSESNSSIDKFIKNHEVAMNLENRNDEESEKSETLAIEQSMILDSRKIEWNGDNKKIIADGLKNRKLVRRKFVRKTDDDKTENGMNKKPRIFSFEEYRKIKQLGRGGFGTVYLCKNPDGKPYAMKKIESKTNRGIPCLMEASIMATYRHDHLTHIICAKAKEDGLYIIMPIGPGGDLSKWRSGNKQSEKIMKCVMHQISQAILFLHELDLIHGDIKCSNILVFDTDTFTVKLSDFNLSSAKSWESNLKVCTATHRPIEVWRGDKWDEKIDIWSFGCALYELKYGHSLIPYQGQNSGKEQYMNAIFDWIIDGKGRHHNKKTTPKYYNISHNKARIPRNIHNKTNTAYMKLMFKMLKSEPTDRPSIFDIVKSSYLSGMKQVKGKRSKRIQKPLNKYLTEKTNDPENIVLISEHKKFNLDLFDQKNIDILKNELSYYTEKPEILEMAVRIYGRYRLITNINNNWTKLTCVWIARKIIRKENYDIRIPIDSKNTSLRKKIYQTEIDICETLGFRLHLH